MATVEAEVIEATPETPTETPAAKVTALERESASLLATVQALVVNDAKSHGLCADYALRGRRMVKAAKELLDPIVDAAHKAHKTAVDQRKKLVEPGERIAALADEKALAYEQAQERLRKEAEEAARREQERLEREAREATEREAERLRKLAEDEALAAAAEAEARGDAETAQRILETPVEIVPPTLPVVTFTPPVPVPTVPQAAGYHTRTTWVANLRSLDDVIRAAASGNTLARSFLAWNQTAADGVARSTKGTVKVPGVEFEEQKSKAGRG